MHRIDNLVRKTSLDTKKTEGEVAEDQFGGCVVIFVKLCDDK